MALALYPWQQPLAESLNRMRSEMPNGLLIYGPRGIGTFDLAERFVSVARGGRYALRELPRLQTDGGEDAPRFSLRSE